MKKNLKEDILDFLFRQTLGIVVSILILTGMVGGGTYLLFNFQNEVAALGNDKISYLQEKQRLLDENELLSLITSGWFTNPQKKEYLEFVISFVKENVEKDELSSSITSDALIWCDASLAQLSLEKGTINGYSTSDEFIISFQNSVVGMYDSQVEITKSLKTLLMTWKELQASGRQDQVAFLDDQMIQQLSLRNTSLSEVKQIQSKSDEDLSQMLALLDEMEGRERQIYLKRNISYGGVFFGVVFISLIFYYRFKDNPSTVPNKVVKKKPVSKKKK